MPIRSKRYFNWSPTRQKAKGGTHYPFLRLIDPIVPDSINVIAGTPTGTVADMQVEADGNVYQVQELNATPGFDFVMTFIGVSFFNFVRVMGAYEGSVTHTPIIQLYNNLTALYETRNAMFHFPTYNLAAGSDVIGAYECKVEDSAKYINAGTVLMRICHPMNGQPAHDIHIDYASLY